jgi:hypothetical protein
LTFPLLSQLNKLNEGYPWLISDLVSSDLSTGVTDSMKLDTNPSGLFQLSAARHLIVDHGLRAGNERPDFGRDLEKNRVQAYIVPKPMDN